MGPTASPDAVADTVLTDGEVRARDYFARSSWSLALRCECPALAATHVCLRPPGEVAGRCLENVRAVWWRWRSLVIEHDVCRLMTQSLMTLVDLEGIPARDALLDWLATGEAEQSTDGMPDILRRWIAPLLQQHDGVGPGWLDAALAKDIRPSPRKALHGDLNAILAARRSGALARALPEACAQSDARRRL